jgi:hypothetical protein
MMADARAVVFEKENVLIDAGIDSVLFLPCHGDSSQVN